MWGPDPPLVIKKIKAGKQNTQVVEPTLHVSFGNLSDYTIIDSANYSRKTS